MNNPDRNTDIDYIYEKYAKIVYRLAYNRVRSLHDAEDVTQEVFLKYMTKKPSFQNTNHEKAWFLRVTINTSKKILTSLWRKRTIPLNQEIEFNDKHDKELHDALRKLPLKYSTVLHLFYYEDMSSNLIAKLLNISESNARMRLTRARRLLRSLLEEDGDIYE